MKKFGNVYFYLKYDLYASNLGRQKLNRKCKHFNGFKTTSFFTLRVVIGDIIIFSKIRKIKKLSIDCNYSYFFSSPKYSHNNVKQISIQYKELIALKKKYYD